MTHKRKKRKIILTMMLMNMMAYCQGRMVMMDHKGGVRIQARKHRGHKLESDELKRKCGTGKRCDPALMRLRRVNV